MATQSFRMLRTNTGQPNDSSAEASSGAVPIFEEAGSSSDDSSASTSSSSTRGRRRFRRGARRKLRWLNKWQQATLKCPNKDSAQLRMHNVEDGVEQEIALRSGSSTPNRFSSNISEVSSLSCLEHLYDEEWLEVYHDEEQNSTASSAIADVAIELQNTQLRRSSTRTNESS